MPAAAASSTMYCSTGRSTTGSSSFGTALVAGRKRVARPAAGMTALTAALGGGVVRHGPRLSAAAGSRRTWPSRRAADWDPDRVTSDTGSPKSAWRRDLLAARRARSSAERAAADSTLIKTLVGTCRDRAVRTVAAYSPLLTEPGGPLLLPALAEVAAEVLLPVLLPDRDLDWERWGGGCHPSGVGSADLVVVPALAVDHGGSGSAAAAARTTAP